LALCLKCKLRVSLSPSLNHNLSRQKLHWFEVAQHKPQLLRRMQRKLHTLVLATYALKPSAPAADAYFLYLASARSAVSSFWPARPDTP
jgi:hypothetical protein